MKKILVTGANGYIGSQVVKALSNKGVYIIATDINVNNIPADADEIIEKNIFDGDSKIFENLGSPDVCLHMAWRDGFVHNSDAHILHLSEHYKFLNSMINGGAKHVAVMGTMHEIGYFEGMIDENTICNPISMYGIAKDSLRRAMFGKVKDTGVVLQWLRAYYIYGNDEKSNSIFAKIVLAEKSGQKLFPFTTGSNKYDFITVSDLANQIASSVTQESVAGIINCCSGVPVSLAEQVEAFIKENEFAIKLDYGVFPDREYDSKCIYGDVDKINMILGKGMVE